MEKTFFKLVAPLWATYMNEVYESRPAPAAWDRPTSLFLLQIDGETGYLATPECPRESVVHEWFIDGTEPYDLCPIHGNEPMPGFRRGR